MILQVPPSPDQSGILQRATAAHTELCSNPKEGAQTGFFLLGRATVGSLGASEGKSTDLAALPAGDRGPAAEPGGLEKRFVPVSTAEQRAAAALSLAGAPRAVPSRNAELFPEPRAGSEHSPAVRCLQ